MTAVHVYTNNPITPTKTPSLVMWECSPTEHCSARPASESVHRQRPQALGTRSPNRVSHTASYAKSQVPIYSSSPYCSPLPTSQVQYSSPVPTRSPRNAMLSSPPPHIQYLPSTPSKQLYSPPASPSSLNSHARVQVEQAVRQLPPPPKVGEKAREPEYYQPVSPSTTYTPQFQPSSPSPLRFASPDRSISPFPSLPEQSNPSSAPAQHPSGYVQNPYATELTASARFAIEQEVSLTKGDDISMTLGYLDGVHNRATRSNSATSVVKGTLDDLGVTDVWGWGKDGLMMLGGKLEKVLATPSEAGRV